MSIIKTRENNAWKSTYVEHFRSLLNRNRNLSDVDSLKEAQKNLELSGTNIENHNHDSQILGAGSPLKTEKDTRIAADQLLDNDIRDYCNYLEEMLSPEEKGWIQRKLSEINNKITQEESNQVAADNNIKGYVQKKLNILNKQIAASENKKAQVPNSEIRQNYTTGVYETKVTNPDRSVTTTTVTEYITPGVNGGIYTLTNLLDKLSNLSHKHTVTNETVVTNCRCDCNDSRCCGGGGH